MINFSQLKILNMKEGVKPDALASVLKADKAKLV